METLYYLIANEEIAVCSVADADTKTPTYRLPVFSDFTPSVQESLADEACYFDVFDEVNVQTQQHIVVNLNNINLNELEKIECIPVRSVIINWKKAQVYAVFKAMQVLRWQQDHTFCSRCGSRTSSHRNELSKVCNTCQYRQYPRLQPCIITAITRTVEDKQGVTKTQILLAKDRRFKRDMYSLIAGFVEVGETLEQAVQREVFEETALQVNNIRYMGSQPWPFPSNIMIAYQAAYKSGQLKIDTNELMHADFFDVDALPDIPPKGSIAHEMIMHICKEKTFEL